MGDRERKIAGNIVRGVVVFILVCGLAGGFGRGYADDNYEDSVLNKLGHSHDILLQELSRSLKKIGSLKRENYILAGALKRLRSQKAPQDRQRDDYRRKYDACQTKLDGYRKEYDACRTEGDTRRKKCDDYRTERDACQTKLDGYRKEYDACRTEGDTRRKKCDDYRTERDACRKERDACRKERDACRKEYDERGYRKVKEEVKRLQRENFLLKERIEAINKKDNRRSKDYRSLQTFKRNLEELKKENAVLSSMLKMGVSRLRRHPQDAASLSQRSSEARMHADLGYLYAQNGRYKMAVDEYTRSLRYENNKDIHYNLGFLYAKIGKFDQAIGEYKRALAGDDSDRDIYYNISIIYANNLNDRQKAIEYYKKTIPSK